MANGELDLPATLIVAVQTEIGSGTPDPSSARLALRVVELSLVGEGRTVALVRDRDLDLPLGDGPGVAFPIAAPAGRFQAIRLGLRQARKDAKTLKSDFPLKLELTPGAPTTLHLTVNATAAVQATWPDLTKLLRVLPGEAAGPASTKASTTGELSLALTIELRPGSFAPPRRTNALIAAPRLPGVHAGSFRVDAARGGLAAGTLVKARLLPGAPPTDAVSGPFGLPALFRRQRVLGPAIEITSSAAPTGTLTLTLPYDPDAASALGVDPSAIAVMQLDDARTLYRELRPLRVDRAARSVSVQTRSLSTFFVCSSGIEIAQPELRIDASGRPSAWTSGSETSVVGRAADERASTTLLDATSGLALPIHGGWQALGWFDFERVALQPRRTAMRLRAEVDGLLPHECEFAVRAAAPPRRITDPARHHGPRLAVGVDDVPLVTAVIGASRFFGDDLVAPWAAWQSGWRRYGPYIYRPSADALGWEWRALLPELHFEEQSARRALVGMQSLLPVPLLADQPLERRALASLAAFVDPAAQNSSQVDIVTRFLDLAGQEFALGTLSVSPTVPVIALPDGRFAAAFVAATVEGNDLARTSSLRDSLGRLYRPLGVPHAELRQVNAGRLIVAIGSFEEGFVREVVAETVWCATLQMRLDPANRRPVLAALEPLADADATQPRSRLVLWRRSGGGTWSREVISANWPILDFDFDFVPPPPGAEGPTSVRFVLALAGAQPFDVKTHLRGVQREAVGWLATTIEYEAPWNRTFISDLGLWPRLHIDREGRATIVFAVYSAGSISWIVAGSRGGTGLRSELVATATHELLTGSPLPPAREGIRFDSPVDGSRLSLAHWAPVIAPALASAVLSGGVAEPRDALFCAFGNGVLNLARIDLETLASTLQVLDVNRMLGFFPALAVRRGGAPALAYKDVWGPGEFGATARDELIFFSYEQGNLMPPTALPLAPPHGRSGFSLTRRVGAVPAGGGAPPTFDEFELVPHVELNCGALIGADPLAILASVVLHRPFHIVVVPREGDDPLGLTRITHMHPGLAAQLGRLRERPTVLALTIDNAAFPAEDIEAIELASFTDPIGRIPRSEIAQLDQGVMTSTVLLALMNTGTRLSQTFPSLAIRQRGSAWDITDPDAYSGGLERIGQTYLLRDNGSDIEIRLPPVVTVVDRAGRLDTQGRPEPCGLPAAQWDDFVAPLASQLDILSFQIPDVPGRLRWLRARGIHVERVAPHDPPNAQQGGVRFTLRIPSFSARIDDPDASVWSTEPSFVEITLAPFVRDGWIGWWVRDSEVRLGHVEVDVDYGFLDWLGVVISLIPGLNLIFIGVDAIADAVATSDVNDALAPPGIGNLQGLLVTLMDHITAHHGQGQPRPLESAWLRGMQFTIGWRARGALAAAPPAQSQLGLLPSFLAFGAATAGAAPLQRNLLLTSDGGAPALVEGLAIVGAGPDFTIITPPAWPQVLLPGDSLVVSVSFTPRLPAGFRSQPIDVIANGGQRLAATLSALVQPPPEPLLRLRPERLQFGVVNAGAVRVLQLELFNDGAGAMEFAAPWLDVGALPAGVLTLDTPAPQTLPPGGAGSVMLRFAPPFGGPNQVQATLRLASNDPARPQVDLAVTATVANGALYVSPTELQFPDSPTAANLPQLPPNLPPTLHAGPTRITTFYNTGAASLVLVGASLRAVDAAGAISPHFALWRADGAALAPVDTPLAAGASLTVVAEFRAATAGAHTARIDLRSNDPTLVPASVTISGVAV